VRVRAKAAFDARGRAQRLGGWLRDIHAQKRSEDQLRHHAFHDALTGLPNRALFMDRLTHALARARRSTTERFAVVVLDLDRFKAINDRLGHVAGDELLIAVSHRLASCLRPGDTVARMAGDEVMLLLEDVNDVDGARRVAERIQRELALPTPIAGQDVTASASIGIAVGDGSIGDAAALLRDADAAMYEAKARGSGQLVTFDARMHDRKRERLELESALRAAIERGELSVYYQPIVTLADRRIVGFEALARFRHPSLGNVAPIRFIPLAEEAGLITEIGAWVLAQATREGARLHRLFASAGPLSMHVNVSARQMEQDPDFVEKVDRALAESGLPPSQLTIEVTEAVIMEDIERGERLLDALRTRGVHVCMDDFGTGYSSLSYLHRFRVDSLKIDLSFVRDLTEPHGKSEIVHTIVSLAKTLGLSAVAEGIETPAQLEKLVSLGCDRGQGYLFSPPVDAASIEALLRAPPLWDR
jgi:diguanylate cyclase (GGDEF)-like protein